MNNSEDNWKTFGAWVADRREAWGMTQPQLAELVGLERQQIYRIEKGGSTRRATVAKIATALKADTQEAINIAFGLPKADKQSLPTTDQARQAARAADLIRSFLVLSPERQAQAVAMIKVLGAENPETIQTVDDIDMQKLGEIKPLVQEIDRS